jgi:hypothetical protein
MFQFGEHGVHFKFVHSPCQSARGQESAQYERGPLCGLQSRTLRAAHGSTLTRGSVLECGCPLPLSTHKNSGRQS